MTLVTIISLRFEFEVMTRINWARILIEMKNIILPLSVPPRELGTSCVNIFAKCRSFSFKFQTNTVLKTPGRRIVGVTKLTWWLAWRDYATGSIIFKWRQGEIQFRPAGASRRCSSNVPISIPPSPVLFEKQEEERNDARNSRGRTMGEGVRGGWKGKKGRTGGSGSGRRVGFETRTIYFANDGENSVNSEAPPIRHCRLKTWPISGENKKEASRGGGGVCIKVSRYVNGIKTVEYISRIDDIRPPRARSFFFSLLSSFSTTAEEITPDVEW